MIRGAHFLLYSSNPPADREFFRDVLDFACVDDGDGWLIFKLPATEMGIHPSNGAPQQHHGGVAMAGGVLYLMCDNVRETARILESKGIECAPLHAAEWGTSTALTLPSGGRIGLYEPKHKMAIEW